MKRKLIIALFTAAGVAMMGPVLFNSIRYRLNPISAALIPVMDGTEWAPNYSFRNFRKIKTGMTTNDVLAIMGPCLAVTEYMDQTHWHYTRGKDGGVMSGSSYSTHIRIVSFGKDGLVASKTYNFYFD